MQKILNSNNLKAELWDTLLKLRKGEMPPTQAIAIAAQARELMRVVKAEMAIAAANGDVPERKLIGLTVD